MTLPNGNGKPAGAMSENKPRLIFWEVTKGCNLRCIHCRATATELSSPTDLPTSTALEIIDQIVAAANPILVLSGGEPLYRNDIFQLARYATDKGLRVALATNGTLVTKDVARMIVDSGVRRVSISLDGADCITHDTFRGIPGAFDAAVHGLRNLKELGMSVQINMTIARHNAHQLPECSATGEESGRRCAPYFPARARRLRRRHCRRTDGRPGRVRTDAQLVLRSVAGGWDRTQSNLRATLFSSCTTTPRCRSPGCRSAGWNCSCSCARSIFRHRPD